MKSKSLIAALTIAVSLPAAAALVVDPNDPRSWQGANVGTFAQLVYGANNAATRQLVVDNQLLDDSNFNAAGFAAATLISAINVTGPGRSLDQPNVNNGGLDGSYAYDFPGGTVAGGANAIDNLWVQTLTQTVGHAVWDLGFQATKAAIFNTIDHGPLPGEAIESSVYLSNDLINWTLAVTQRVWLEGIYSDTTVLWDGFVYAVGTPGNTTFRYASIIWGGPGALLSDGDNEINGVMGLQPDFQPPGRIPEPATLALLGLGLLGIGWARRRKS